MKQNFLILKLLVLCLVLCLSISFVNASCDLNSTCDGDILLEVNENINDDILTVDSTSDVDCNDTLKATNMDRLSADYTSLSDLNTLVKVTPDRLSVNDNYIYDGTPFTVAKSSYIIDFNGHTIDANGSSERIITVSGNNVTIKNLKFINSQYSLMPIAWMGSDGCLDGITISNSSSGIEWTGANGKLTNLIAKDYNQCKGSFVYAPEDTSGFTFTNSELNNLTYSSANYCIYIFGEGSIIRHVDCKNVVNTYGDQHQLFYIQNTNMYDCTIDGCTYQMLLVPFLNCFVSNCTFKNSVARNHRGCVMIYSNAIGIDIIDCKFINCSDTYYASKATDSNWGSIVWINNPTSRIINCIFESNQACSIVNSKTAAITDCEFYNNVAKFGTVRPRNANGATIIGSVFINNTATVSGSGVYSNNLAFTVDNCTFINNTSPQGVIRISVAKTTVINSTFKDNKITNPSYEPGRDIYSAANLNIKINEGNDWTGTYDDSVYAPGCYDDSYTYLYVSQNGEGVGRTQDDPTTFADAIGKISEWGTIEFLNTNGSEVFNDIHATISVPVTLIGNGVTLTTSDKRMFTINAGDAVVFENFKFKNCVATSNSDYSPIFIQSFNNKFSNCEFIDCKGKNAIIFSDFNAGMTYVYNLQFENCNFTRNTVTVGGMIRFSSAGSKISNCKFEDNVGGQSGGIVFTGYNELNRQVINCTFIGNTANGGSAHNTVGAGAIFMTGMKNANSPTNISGCKFENNKYTGTHSYGAAGIYVDDNIYGINIEFSNFTENTGARGAVCVKENSDRKFVDVSNCRFIGNSANSGSGVYSNSKLNLRNSVFEDNKVSLRGSAVFVGNYGVVDNCTFIRNGNNSLVWYALSDCTLSVSNSRFEDNFNGSAILVVNGKSLDVSYCNFTNNKGIEGAAIYSPLLTSLSYCNFDNNNVSNRSGAVYLGYNESSISNCNFTNNYAKQEAGAVYIDSDDLIIEYSRFVNNYADSKTLGGGAIYSVSDNVLIFDSYFTDNVAAHYGGAIYIDGIHYYFVDNVTRMTFKDNVALNKTGWPEDKDWNDIYDYNSTSYLSEVHVVLYPDSIPNNNYTGDINNPINFDDAFRIVAPGGSIIFINSSEVYTSFSSGIMHGLYNGYQLSCVKYGVHFYGNNTTIVNLRFIITNRAHSLEFNNIIFRDCSNSTLIFESDNCVVDNCSFINNGGDDCIQGACIQIFGDNLLINNTDFIDNSVSSPNDAVGGGAIYCNASDLSIINCNFNNNQANTGSNILVSSESFNVTIKNSTFTNSHIVDIGVASIVVYCSKVDIVDSYFNNNNNVATSSVVDGGAILFEGNIFHVNVENNTFINNGAHYGGAIAFSGNPSGIVVNNTFKDNVAVYGGALYVTGKISVVNSSFFNNSATNGSAIYVVSLNNDIEDSFFASPKYDENNNVIQGYVYSRRDVSLRNNTLSFTDLNKTVSEASTNLDLEFNYKYFKDYDAPFVNGVSVSNGLSINGNNYVLDGDGKARILSVNSCKLSNITFINGSAQDGGAIQGSNAVIHNCSFINNKGTRYGSAIMSNSFNITECHFVNNTGANAEINFNTGTNYCTYCIFSKGGKVTNSGNNCVVNINYNAFLNGSYPDVRSNTNPSYNWFGENKDHYMNYPCLNATLNFASLSKSGSQYVYVFNVTFVKSDSGEAVDVRWTRPVNYTVTNLTSVIGNVSGLNTGTTWKSNMALWNLSAVVDNQNLTPYLYPYLALQYLIDYSNANFTLGLCHDYTYSPVVDANNLPNGIVIDKKIILEGNQHCIDGVNNGTCRAFYITANYVVINNLTIKNSKQLGANGGAIIWTGSNGVIANSTLKNNGDSRWSYCRGGAFYWTGNYATIDNCDFTGNSVGLGGSAVWLQGDYANITSSNFTGGSSNGWGGTLVLNSAKYCTVSDCIFKNTDSAATGGAIHQYNSACDNMVVLNTQFIDCYARDSAGGLTISSTDAYVYNCTFDRCLHNNYVSGVYGGAVYWSGSNGQLLNSTFTGNYLHHQFSRYINAYGGAVVWAGLNGTLSYCNFTGNYIENAFSVRAGGAVYWSGSDGNINYCNFTNHNVINGGAVFISGSCLVNESVFVDNHATNGGAVYISGFGLISNTDFKDNTAVNGGAVYSTNNITVISSDFTNNSADYGGAIYLLDGHSTILDTTFEDNHAINGSAIYIVTSVNHWYNLDFINNVASTNATVYFREDSTVYSDNLTFTGNVIPNGLHIVGENHIYSPRIYVNQTHPGFGIIMIEPASMEWAVDNILDNGVIIICSDYTLEAIIKLNNLTNVTVTGNHTLRKDKYQFILPRSWGKIRILKLLHQKPITLN